MTARVEPAALIAWASVTAALTYADVHHPIRSLFALVFFAFVPGLAVVRLCRFGGLGARLLLAAPTSLALAAVVSAVLTYSGIPMWNLGLGILIIITAAFVALDILLRSRWHEGTVPRRKLDDEARQAAMIQVLLAGGSISEAAGAAGVHPATLRRALRRSSRLSMAVSVATHGESELRDVPRPHQQDSANRDRQR